MPCPLTPSAAPETLSGIEREAVTVRLTADELALLIDGLDAFKYWEAGFVLPRNNGEVFIPGDLLTPSSRCGDVGQSADMVRALPSSVSSST